MLRVPRLRRLPRREARNHLVERDVAQHRARAFGSFTVLDRLREADGRIGFEPPTQRRQSRIGRGIDRFMELGPAGDADQNGVGQRRPIADEERRVADHRFQLGMTVGDRRAAEVAQGPAIGRISVLHLQRGPQGTEGAGEAGIEEAHELMHAIGFRSGAVEAQAPLDVARFQPAGDGQRLGDRPAVVGDQDRRLAPVVEPAIGVALHVRQHVDAAQAIGLAQPFEGGDKAHRAAERKAVDEDRFHVSLREGASGLEPSDPPTHVNYAQFCNQDLLMKDVVSRCPIEEVMRLLSGRWPTLLLYYLKDGTKRFSDLKRDNPTLSHRMLALELRKLEGAGVIRRTARPGYPLRVEYDLMPAGLRLVPLIDALGDWWEELQPAKSEAA